MNDLLHKHECYQIIGACFEVYRNKGCGFHESVYQECLEIEFDLQGIAALSQVPLDLEYKGRALTRKYIPDFICYNSVIVELKALDALSNDHRAQVLNYLKATGMDLWLLVNFGHFPKLEWERVVLTNRPI